LLDQLLPLLPCEMPRCLAQHGAVDHEAALWWFVGRNASASERLPGRPEHTDAVVHDGTWHFQLEGRKDWTLRPTDEWRARCVGGRTPRTEPTTVRCEAGDVLVVSTRDWWHATSLPPLDGGLSVSYAREFSLQRAGAAAAADDGAPGDDDGKPTVFTNVDGLFATCAIRAGTVIATEDDPGMAGAELAVSADPNCAVAEDEATELQCLVALRDIRSGEFLCVAADD
jgi:hypothetical protein